MAKMVVSITRKGQHGQGNSRVCRRQRGVVSGVETVVFLSSEGVHLSHQWYSDDTHEEGLKPLKELVESFTSNGGTIWVCSPYFIRRGLGEDKLVSNAVIVGGAKLVEFLSQGASCITY